MNIKNHGRPRGKAHTSRSFRLSKNLDKQINKHLKKKDESFSAYIRKLILRDLKLRRS